MFMDTNNVKHTPSSEMRLIQPYKQPIKTEILTNTAQAFKLITEISMLRHFLKEKSLPNKLHKSIYVVLQNF